MNDQPHDHTDPTPEVLNPRRAMLAGLGGLAAGAFLAGAKTAHAGPLTPPPGPVAPTPGPEPRIPINAINTPGDADSIFRITQPGSYYLTGNVQGLAQRSGIKIAASNVTIDLMGYALLGVQTSRTAIITAGAVGSLTVRNGTLSGWGQGGLDFRPGSGSDSIIESVIARNNSGVGIATLPNSVVRDCVARLNTGGGIIVPTRGSVHQCAAVQNGDAGIRTGNGCVVTNCSATLNNGAGIITENGCRIADCVCSFNTAQGITLADGGVITGCSIISNSNTGIVARIACTISDCTVALGVNGGIQVAGGCIVRNNTCRDIRGGIIGFGINASGTGNQIGSNNCTGNDLGIRIGVANNFITRNTCSANTTNWQIAAGNACLVVATTPAAAFTGNSGGTSPGSTNPNANYTY